VNATKSLALANTITANGPVSILGTLSGNGTIAGSGAVTLGANGLVSPGNSVGALTVGPLTIDGKYLYEIVAGVADLITVNGNLTVGGTSVLEGPNAPSVNYATPGLVQVDDGGTWRTIIAYSGSLAGTFATVPVALSAFEIE